MSYEEPTLQENTTNTNNDGCAGCGCAIVLLIIGFSVVSWAWNIHWLFGLLMLLFILGIRMIKEAGADEAVLHIKSLEAFAKAADGRATKIIIPSEIQSLAGLVASVKEIAAK